ncbi:catalase [Gallaecimonas xiamenensis]|uniref:Catalase n=1 Tax=Gallaecimonas xiamenensis 3-C-1 TaxID=745411 RepID=K2IYY4_9GAMM|nr:catalase [Gallaecimonas xiamenensis]EKE67752.1 catalase [Gallaecimonas xiamenensis 3-C-1]
MSQSPYTLQNGAPVTQDNLSITAGPRGPLTFDNIHLFEKLAHFNRERIPERVVHARGTGAYGTFTLTQDLSELSIADFLQQEGKQTPVFLRFSTVAGGQDSGDYVRDVRGFALKFYTAQGNYDIVGNNTPVFFIRDPLKFPDFIHSQKKDPRTNLPNPAHHFEFWANHPQSLHQVTILMSDRGIPQDYRHLNGYGSHTLSLYNSQGQRFWVKWHFKTNQGVKNLTGEEVAKRAPHQAQQDLVEAIDRGDFPSWTVKLQVMTEQQARHYHINPFDLTKVWPHRDFPLRTIGQLQLNRNVGNYFAETEQVTFSPANLVPGTGVSPDKVLQGRLFAYADAHRYRVGVNHNQLPVNAPRCPVNHYQRDGAMAGMGCPVHQGGTVNFSPNDRQDTPKAQPQFAEPPLPMEGDAWLGSFDDQHSDNFSQAGDLYRLFDDGEKDRLAANIAGGLSQADGHIQERMLAQFEQADPDYKARVAAALAKLA